MINQKIFWIVALLTTVLTVLIGPDCPNNQTDTAAPEFDGLNTIYSCDGTIGLEWNTAHDDQSPVTYHVYMSQTSGDYNWDAPLEETIQTQTSITGLVNDQTYFFMVRATDQAGNQENNLNEKSVKPTFSKPYPQLPFKELIFEPGTLPPTAHSSCMIEMPNQDLLAIWYSGSGEHEPDVAIRGAKRPLGANSWDTPMVIQDTPDLPDGNAVLYLGQDNKLWLFWALQEKFEWHTAVLNYKTSDDLGQSWTPPQEFGTAQGMLPRTHPTTLSNGWIILPLYVEWSASSILVISKDNGASWELPPDYILHFWGIQPTVIQRSDFSLYALMRSGAPPQQSWEAQSVDYGESWKNPRISQVNNPGSSLEMIKLHNGSVVLAFNNSKVSRANLSLALSTDDGATWSHIKAIEDFPDDSGQSHSYPSVIQDKCGNIHVTYSTNDGSRSSIAHFVTNQSWIETP